MAMEGFTTKRCISSTLLPSPSTLIATILMRITTQSQKKENLFLCLLILMILRKVEEKKTR